MRRKKMSIKIQQIGFSIIKSNGNVYVTPPPAVAAAAAAAAAAASMKADSPSSSASCSLFKFVGANDLSINDIVVKSSVGTTACIKARFSLAIKVEALLENFIYNNNDDDDDGENSREENSRPTSPALDSNDNNGDLKKRESNKIVLGYLPLDSVIAVEDSCPEMISTQKNVDSTTTTTTTLAMTTTTIPPIPTTTASGENNNNNNSTQQQQDQSNNNNNNNSTIIDPKELNMIVKFDCGLLTFEFKKDDAFYLSAIKGTVRLDSSTTREFLAEQPMFFTSDLIHHFKFNDLIEVGSTTTNSKGFILTANFYNSEFEVFRNTTSRSFIRPPDDNSKPFTEKPI